MQRGISTSSRPSKYVPLDIGSMKCVQATSFVVPIILGNKLISKSCLTGFTRQTRTVPGLSHFTHQPCNRTTFSHTRTDRPCQPQSLFTTSKSNRDFPIELSDTPTSAQSQSANAYDLRSPGEESLALLEWPAITKRVLSYASTDLGRTQLVSYGNEEYLYIPSTRLESEQLLQQTREANVIAARGGINLQGAINAHPLAEIASKGRVLTGLEIHLIGKTLRITRETRRQIINIGPESLPYFHEIAGPLSTLAEVEREIVRCIDEYGEINESALPELAETRQQIRESTSNARATLQQIMSTNSEAIQDRIITSRYDRLVIPVKTSHKNSDAFRSGVVHDASASGSTTYVEPTNVRPLNDRLRKLAAKERAIIVKELRRLSQQIVAPVAPQLQTICSFIAVLDAANARAQTGKSLNAVDVRFDNDRKDKSLHLPSVRHPLLMWGAVDAHNASPAADPSESEANRESSQIQFTQNKPPWHDAVVPSTYTLASSVRCVCVTGPNTGGKTLTLKTLGVVALMAKAGIFIPASPVPTGKRIENGNSNGTDGLQNMLKLREDECVSIPFFDAVLADIGDDQSLVQSLSTFSGHVRRIKRILAASTSQSLVLLDEIGSGTVCYLHFNANVAWLSVNWH